MDARTTRTDLTPRRDHHHRRTGDYFMRWSRSGLNVYPPAA
jgi:hypothetical protein